MNAEFGYMMGMSIDAKDNLYVTDRYNRVIRQVTSTNVYTFAGNRSTNSQPVDGNQFDSKFSSPTDIVYITNSTWMVADSNFVRIINASK